VTQKERRFPEYDLELIQRIREWMEESRYKRYRRFTRSLDEAIIELCYFIILKLLDIDGRIDKLEEAIKEIRINFSEAKKN
jgi:hypothetical protein